MTACRWCALTPSQVHDRVLAAAREGRDADLGRQCYWCQRADWGLKSINHALVEIEARRMRAGRTTSGVVRSNEASRAG